MTETTTIARWLYATLSADEALTAAAPGGVWRHPAPPDVTDTFVTFQLQEAFDTVAVGNNRVLTRTVWAVRATGRDMDTLDLEPAAGRIDALLNAQSRNTPGGIVHSSTRTGSFDFVETDNGVRWAHLGGLYRIHVS